jgi:hypothetical protein
MKKAGLIATTAALLALWATGIAAHHSAQQFDFGRSVAISGVVKRFQSINPHMRLVITVSDAKGTRDISFEGHSTNNMFRAGYRDGMIKVGDKITVYVAPLRDGADGGYVTAASTADGRRFGPQSRAEQEAERAKAEGRP